jgi:hypothetical protein
MNQCVHKAHEKDCEQRVDGWPGLGVIFSGLDEEKQQ